MSFIKRVRLFIVACAMILGFGGLVPAVVMADTAQQTVCSTLGAGSDCTADPHGSVDIGSVIKAIVNILSYVIGVVAVIMVMVSGFRYVTSGGDSSKVSGAKNTLVYAVVGLVVAALAQVIVKFVLSKVK